MALRLPFERLLSFLVPIQLEVMAPRGLELVFQCALPSITTKQDVLVVFVHWKLISKGFLCLGVGTEVISSFHACYWMSCSFVICLLSAI